MLRAAFAAETNEEERADGEMPPLFEWPNGPPRSLESVPRDTIEDGHVRHLEAHEMAFFDSGPPPRMDIA